MMMREGALVGRVLEIKVCLLTHDATGGSSSRSDRSVLGVSSGTESEVKLRIEALRRKFNPIACYSRGKRISERIAFGADSMHVEDLLSAAEPAHRTGFAVKSNGTPKTSAYSTLKRPSSFRVVGLSS